MDDQAQVPAVASMAEYGRPLMNYSRVCASGGYGISHVRTLLMPLMGPTVTPWSMGIMTAFPVFRLTILSMRIDVPLNSIPLSINVLISTSLYFYYYNEQNHGI